MALEMAAVAVGLKTFESSLINKRVRIWIDNAGQFDKKVLISHLLHTYTFAGGEGALFKGAAKQADHHYISHAVWMHAAMHGISLWIERVPSKDNIADEPSRWFFGTMSKLQATWTEPARPLLFNQPKNWETVLLKTGTGTPR